MSDKPVLDRVLRRAHSELKGEIETAVGFIKECGKPFPKEYSEHEHYINDRLKGGKYSSGARTA